MGLTAASFNSSRPFESITTTLGRMPRRKSGPPVAVSSIAAATKARTARSTPPSLAMPGENEVRKYDLASREPEPVDPKSSSSYRPPTTSKL
jgi:hypothetical protein